MITCRTFLLAFSICALAAGCGDEATEDSDDDGSASSASSASGASSGSGGGQASSTGDPAGGAGGQGAQGGAATGGASGEISVEMSVEPDTMPAGATVDAIITVQNFVLEAATGQPNAEAHGHFHIYLDEAQGIDYLVSDHVSRVAVEIPADTTPGAHTLRVSLGQNSHAPLDPPVADIVDITVTQ